MIEQEKLSYHERYKRRVIQFTGEREHRFMVKLWGLYKASEVITSDAGLAKYLARYEGARDMFCLISGADPDDVDLWVHGQYMEENS